jgi:hypothetical protein
MEIGTVLFQKLVSTQHAPFGYVSAARAAAGPDGNTFAPFDLRAGNRESASRR